LERKLEDLAVMLDGVATGLQDELLAATLRLPRDPEAVRALGRRHPRLRRLLIVDPQGRPRFPPSDGTASEDEQRLVRDTRFLWDGAGPLSRPSLDGQGRADHGWQPLADGEGVGLLFWRRTADGSLVAVSLPSAAIQAALVARLPVTVPNRTAGDERIALFDPAGRLVYQWGAYQPLPGSKPLVALWLRPPFGVWRLAYLGPVPARGRATLGIAGGLVALALVVVGAGFFLYRESTRELRLAAQRVSFVNQVSHELKTPLTNVRMYAELLEENVEDPVGRQRLGVVVAESQRLGRLITNILTFARAEKGTLAVQPGAGCVDDVVRSLLDQFAPSFEACGVSARFDAGAPGRVKVDVDALTQILGNLFGNVEKYAPRGPVVVRTDAAPPITRILVEDSGPGIPATERERVFQPFVRLGTASHEGVPGTGIGLGLARDLARRHGGELRILPAEQGARFEVILITEEVA
ncbi:MAG TPA: HAMP domain-containing sensor histidine kinase, partial [Polyangia bacterium]|nr:HAMP domain-containing sensor histidine kinase [Polyangia bacterium]